jgi:hypothetical protein
LFEWVARNGLPVHALDQKYSSQSAASARPAGGRAKAFCPPQWGALTCEIPSSASGLAVSVEKGFFFLRVCGVPAFLPSAKRLAKNT